jgi:hypothetical protein
MFRKIALSGLMALGLAGTAQAAVYNINLGNITPSFDTDGIVTVGTGAFVYDFFFTASAPYIGAVSVADLPSVSLGSQRYNVTGLSLALWQDAGTLGVKDAADVFLGSFGSGDYISVQTPGAWAAGSYFFEATGTGTGTDGGRLSYTASAVAVPEPQTYAMLLAGLGAIGFLARRRRA